MHGHHHSLCGVMIEITLSRIFPVLPLLSVPKAAPTSWPARYAGSWQGERRPASVIVTDTEKRAFLTDVGMVLRSCFV
jgi:hypothetical protein